MLVTQQHNERYVSLTWEFIGLSWATETINTSQQHDLRQFGRYKITQLAGLSVDLVCPPKAVGCYSESCDHSDWKGPLEVSGPTPVHSRLVTQGCVQPSFEYLQGPPQPLWASLPATGHTHC